MAAALAAGMAVIGGQTARADVITEDFTFATLSGYTTESGSSFAGFDSALGTLTEVDLAISVTPTWSGGGSTDFDSVLYTISVGSEPQPIGIGQTGNGTLPTTSYQASSSGVAFLAAFTGGTLSTSVDVQNMNDTVASISSTFGTETVTYDYTPAASTAVPEPGSLALLATGLFGLALLRRRRRA